VGVVCGGEESGGVKGGARKSEQDVVNPQNIFMDIAWATECAGKTDRVGLYEYFSRQSAGLSWVFGREQSCDAPVLAVFPEQSLFR